MNRGLGMTRNTRGPLVGPELSQGTGVIPSSPKARPRLAGGRGISTSTTWLRASLLRSFVLIEGVGTPGERSVGEAAERFCYTAPPSSRTAAPVVGGVMTDQFGVSSFALLCGVMPLFSPAARVREAAAMLCSAEASETKKP